MLAGLKTGLTIADSATHFVNSAKTGSFTAWPCCYFPRPDHKASMVARNAVVLFLQASASLTKAGRDRYGTDGGRRRGIGDCDT